MNSVLNEAPLFDSLGRVATKLRISVTDRCNFRCSFCMPTHPVWLPRDELLTFEEISRLVRIFASMGINKIRLSGGEPLVRQDIEKLVGMLTKIPGIESVAMTTNGFFLAEKAVQLKQNGLNGVTVSLHSLKAERFEAIIGVRNTFEKVLSGIKAAKAAGIPLKINTVLTRGCNEDEIIDFARIAYEGQATVRFIEYMPFDGKRMWGMEKVVSGKETVEEIRKVFELVEFPREHGSTAKIYRFTNGSKGEIGIITSMTEPFCSDCDRNRLKADGKIVPCLFSPDEYDAKKLMRKGATDEELGEFIKRCYWKKSLGIETMLKEQVQILHVRPMHTIGG